MSDHSASTSWQDVSKTARFRASVGEDARWPSNLPDPGLIDASTISSNGRELLAFNIKEVRDYFVEGHAHQGAQIEPDWATVATDRRATPEEPETTNDINEAIIDFEIASGTFLEAEASLDAAIRYPAMELFNNGRQEEALSIIKTLPADSISRIIAYKDIMASGLWDFKERPLHTVETAPLTAAIAGALTIWNRENKNREKKESNLSIIAYVHAGTLMEHLGNEAVIEFAKRLPNSMTKAMLMDYGRTYVRTEEEAAGPKM